MDTLPVHGSWLKFLGGVALAAACCVVVGLIALTFSHHPCLGLNKAGGEGSCAAPVTISQHRRFPPRPHLSAFGIGAHQEGVECVLRRVFPASFLTSEERTSRMSPCTPRRKCGAAGNDGQRCGHSRHTADSSGAAANYSEPLAAEILAAAGKSIAMVTCGNNFNINSALGRDGGRPLCDGPSCPHGQGPRLVLRPTGPRASTSPCLQPLQGRPVLPIMVGPDGCHMGPILYYEDQLPLRWPACCLVTWPLQPHSVD